MQSLASIRHGRNRLAEGADVQYPTVLIQRGQCRCGPSFQLQLTEIIVFDDPGVVLFSPVEQ
jgi:hypothetical protein